MDCINAYATIKVVSPKPSLTYEKMEDFCVDDCNDAVDDCIHSCK